MELGTKEFNDSAMEMFGGKPKQQTAVEWLEEALSLAYQIEKISLRDFTIKKLFKQAKEMEKEQIIDAVDETNSKWKSQKAEIILTGEQYYKETFNK